MATFMCIPRGYLLHLNPLKASNILRWTTVNSRDYARIFHRNPIKVLTSEEATKLSKPSLVFEEKSSFNENKFTLNPSFEKKGQGPGESRNNDSNYKTERNEQKSFDTPKKFNSTKKNTFTKSTENFQKHSKDATATVKIDGLPNPYVTDKIFAERKISSLLQCVKSVKARKISGKILLEGERLIEDAFKAGVPAEALFFSNPELLKCLPLKNQPLTELYKLSYDKIQLWSDLTTSPGIMGVFDINNRPKSSLENLTKQLPLTIICDKIKDPGNMGSIIRCAAAVGCQTLITTPDCVDVWDSKVLRAAAGGHFRINLDLDIDWDLIAGNYGTEETTVILADSIINKNAHANKFSDKEQNYTDLANRSNFLRMELKNEATTRTIEVLEGGNVQKRDSSYTDTHDLRIYKRLPIPHFSYDELRLNSNNPVLLVIGGEAQGLSLAAHKMAHEFGGFKVSIPLENEVESLNAGVAFGILAYEIRRLILPKSTQEKSIKTPESNKLEN